MGQVPTTRNSHLVSELEALRLQLKEDGKVYKENPNPKEAHDRLLHTLQTNDCREIIAAVLDGGELANVFVRAGAFGHVDVLDAFLHHGMNVDVKNQNAWTALISASCDGQEECVQFLLDRNAMVDIQDRYGYTALMHASEKGYFKIVEMLLEKNANFNIQSEYGWAALMRASLRGHKEIVELLLNHGADVELKTKNGNTALILANNEEIKELLQNHVSSSYVLK